eukprot:5750864-Prymnesium_polylepis.1
MRAVSPDMWTRTGTAQSEYCRPLLVLLGGPHVCTVPRTSQSTVPDYVWLHRPPQAPPVCVVAQRARSVRDTVAPLVLSIITRRRASTLPSTSQAPQALDHPSDNDPSTSHADRCAQAALELQ